MGSPLSPLLDNVNMYKMEESFKTALLQPTVLMRYLDDYFALWSHGREKLEEFSQFVNQIDAKIQFTMEVEEGEPLPFLNVEVIRSNAEKEIVQKEVLCGDNTPFAVPSQLQAEDWNNEEPTSEGCRFLGRGAEQID
ncbi:unnamed protein product [Protopolystoma xenopodis]|uniref:Reverse transcriptase domain-containing protein n=1 Tax=Protopolystoma xenopodis TaxID=117903 RepID=A0A3S5BTQ9_9PLAT|nr:unnamed protein product [Protopolystoma xenopodis]